MQYAKVFRTRISDLQLLKMFCFPRGGLCCIFAWLHSSFSHGMTCILAPCLANISWFTITLYMTVLYIHALLLLKEVSVCLILFDNPAGYQTKQLDCTLMTEVVCL